MGNTKNIEAGEICLNQKNTPASLIIPGRQQKAVELITSGHTLKTLSLQEKKVIEENLLDENVPEIIKPLVHTLYNHTSIENLRLCSENLKTLTLVEKKIYKIALFRIFCISSGNYNTKDNIITINTQEGLPHEFLHMASTPVAKNQDETKDFTGFYNFSNGKFSASGLNEGYTEMLSRRLFFNKDYHTNAYIENVYLMRIFEQLYEPKENMTAAYLNADYTSPIKQFLQYGTIEEYLKLMQDMDYYAECMVENNEEQKSFDLLRKLVEKTEDNNKVIEAEKITSEYYEYKKTR